MSTNDILKFDGIHFWLSNFCPSPVVLDGVTYPTVENAYQAAKAPIGQRSAFVTCTPGQSKKLGRQIVLTPEQRIHWDAIKVDVMDHLLRQKFSRTTLCGVLLQETGSVQIVEGNTWGDTYWGVCNGVGENVLGKLLMRIRDDIN